MLFLFVDGLGLGGALEDLFPFLLALAPTPLGANGAGAFGNLT